MSTKDKILLEMLIFVPMAIGAEWLKLPAVIIFIVSALGIIPLASLIAGATEGIAVFVGPSLGGLLNATFGNLTEMVVSLVALKAGFIEVVKASIMGSIIANLLLALGLAILLGGLRFKEQNFQPKIARLNGSSLILALIVLLTPTAIHETSAGLAPEVINNFSYAASILLLIFYGLTFLFSMKTHKDMYNLEELEEEDHQEESPHARKKLGRQVLILLVGTLVLVLVSEILVGSLEEAVKVLRFTGLFTGVILLPLFAGVVEYIACVTFAIKNKMELAVAVAMSSTLQIVLFVAPILVLAGLILGQPMNLDFNKFDLVAVTLAVIITNSISNDGQSNWLEGVLLLIAYAALGTAFYLHP